MLNGDKFLTFNKQNASVLRRFPKLYLKGDVDKNISPGFIILYLLEMRFEDVSNTPFEDPYFFCHSDFVPINIVIFSTLYKRNSNPLCFNHLEQCF